ncbi:MAG: hypothetical protein KJN76_09740, partial [Eudoraea sp.]|nr:hypothetical protein [Eudoraea sp.]
MNTTFKKISLLTFALSLGLVSCTNEEEDISLNPENVVKVQASLNNGVSLNDASAITGLNQGDIYRDFALDPQNVVQPSDCGTTPFNDVISASVSSNIDLLGQQFFELYAEMNFLYTITDNSEQTFGADGQYTNLVKKITRNLETFWNMPDEIIVRGQHNATLNDFDKIVQIRKFWYGLTQEEAESDANIIINVINEQSTFLIESPLLSFDGFAISLNGFLGQNDLIVIGDGLVELASEAGVQDKVVWNGIMAHEWAHHIQTNNRPVWYPNGAADNEPEATRTTELEADFFTGYYLTHKRGATYNWKRVEDFLELFFNIGDCLFTNPGHHGTPLQRLEAARQGFELAKSAQKNGKILSEDEVHTVFIDSLNDI